VSLPAFTTTGPNFDHLNRLTDDRGLFEHARHAVPRTEHGYCLDDAARALVVTVRQPRPDATVSRLSSRYLEFVLAAIDDDGCCHNRMSIEGEWTDDAGLGDWWGRALWGLGAAAVSAQSAGLRARALAGFRRVARQRSPHLRSMTFAALGAGELIRVRPEEASARALLVDAVALLEPIRSDRSWPWLEPRLGYGNAALPEAVILAGSAFADDAMVERGLASLAFLLKTELRNGHLSVTPVGGRGPDDSSPGFDQQPIEVAALADACASAYRVSGDAHWISGIRLAWRWFLGDNDSFTAMFDPATGGGYDGLEAAGPNLNQGAESTLAMLSTAQHAERIGAL
jgi:hypothetical protein